MPQLSCFPASSLEHHYSPSPLRALAYSNKHHHHQRTRVALFFLPVRVALKLSSLRIHPPRLCRMAVFSIETNVPPSLCRGEFFWRMRANLGLACAQAATLCTQVVGHTRSCRSPTPPCLSTILCVWVFGLASRGCRLFSLLSLCGIPTQTNSLSRQGCVTFPPPLGGR